MAMFKGFKPQGLQKIANSMGYTGSLEGFDSYLQQNPDKQNMMNMYNQRAVQMARGGAVRRMAVGGVNQAGQFQSAMPTGNPADMEQFPIAKAELGGNMIPAGQGDQTSALQNSSGGIN